MLRVSFGEAVFQAPEAPRYVEVALRLLEVYRAELQNGTSVPKKAEGTPGRAPGRHQRVVRKVTQEGSRPVAKFEVRRSRRGRWFTKVWPRITLPEGGAVTPRTLEELQEFIRSMGATPHPRGDASMLLWQLRKRLGLQVVEESATNAP